MKLETLDIFNFFHRPHPRAIRHPDNPIIRPDMLPADDGKNINGPSMIRIPPWIENPLGKYYLYFAHHQGKYIRLAYADHIHGPWKIYAPGTLRLEQTLCNDPLLGFVKNRHIASPDVHLNDDRKEIVMYFHGPLHAGGPADQRSSYRQMTLRATSRDGLHFTAEQQLLGPSYFRIFQWQNTYYAVARGGTLYRSKDGISPFEKGPNPFKNIRKPSQLRHAAVHLDGDVLYVYYSRIGDKPESILRSKIQLTTHWNTWNAKRPELILKPEKQYEGAHLPLQISREGISPSETRELRDPAIFDEDGKTYLLYSVAGENGIALAEIL